MYKTTVKVTGMACGMCESHVNHAVRNHFQVKKVTSSCKKGETVILSEEKPDEESLEKVIEDTGYSVGLIITEPYEKKRFFKK